MTLTSRLAAEYEQLFDRCEIRKERRSTVQWYINQLLRHRARYVTFVEVLPVPWWWVGITHALESGFRFDRHLHNGDPLTARTRRVPAGRPATGKPPFTWEVSAEDAIRLKGLDGIKPADWGRAMALYQWERYNGFGYRLYQPHVLSPYLWSGSTHYTRGKYVKDSVFSATAISDQIGAGVLLRRLADLGEVCVCF